MPNPKALWIVSCPSDGSPEEQLQDLEAILGSNSISNGTTSLLTGGNKLGSLATIEFPDFKVSY